MFEQFKGFTSTEAVILTNLIGLLKARKIIFLDIRTALGLLEMRAIRFAAQHRRRAAVRHQEVNYSVSELAKLLGITRVSSIKQSIARLEEAGILVGFSHLEIEFNLEPLAEAKEILEAVNRTSKGTLRNPMRKIPIPRCLLKCLSQSTKRSCVCGTIAYLLRCFSFGQHGLIKAVGSAKSSWIAEIAGISIASAKRLRQWLISLCWLKPDTGSSRRKQNRTGAYCEFDFSRMGKLSPVAVLAPAAESTETVGNTCHSEEGDRSCSPVASSEGAENTAINDPVQRRGLSHPIAENERFLSHPYKNINLPTEYKNQNLTPLPSCTGFSQKKSGVCKQTSSITNVVPEDLESLDRLEVLFSDAVRRKLVANSPVARLNFVAAAVRARQVHAAGKGRDAVRIFTGIVRRGLYHVISQAQEEKARAWINRERGAIDEFAEALPSRAKIGTAGVRVATVQRRVAVGLARTRAVVANAKESERAEVRLPCRLFALFQQRIAQQGSKSVTEKESV